MADEKKPENIDSKNGEEPTLDELLKQNGEAKDMESLKKLNEQVFARLKKAEEKLKDPTRNEADGQNGGKKKPPSSEATPEDAPISVLEYAKLQESGASNKKILNIANLAKELKISVSQVMANPTLMAGIDAQEKQSRGRDNTPPPSGRVGSIPSNDEIPGYNEAKTPSERLGAVTAQSRKVFEERVQGKKGGSEE